MAINAVKIAVSLPKEDFRLLEAMSKKLGLSRSALVDRAIHYWLSKRKEEAMIRQYIEGYRRYPETSKELKELAAMEKAQAETMEEEDWS